MNCEEKVSTDWSKSSPTCSKLLNYIESVSGGVTSYDAREFDREWNAKSKNLKDFILRSGKRQELYKSLHIN